jgi:CHAT domain-containing protein/tetratricopeptide (TPR) repeat protein
MRGILIAAAAISTIPSLLAPRGVPQSAEGTLLVPGSILERHIARGDDQRFQLTISPGVVTIVVEQRGIDVQMLVRDASGAVIDTVQDAQGPSGEERTEIATKAGVTVTLSVQAAPGTVAAGDYRIRVDDPRRATADDDRLQEARTLRARALEIEGKGRYPEAHDLLQRAIDIAEPIRGTDDTMVAYLVFELAGNALQRQENTQSRALYEQAIRSFEKTLGTDDPYAAMARSRIALVEERVGQRQKAEADIRAVLPVLERTLGVDHPWYLQSLVTFANLRESAGDVEQAEEIERRGLASVERTGQAETMLHATFLNNLADILRSRGDYAGAEPLFARSMAIGESILGGDSLFVATALQNLGIMARERKDYAAAIADYQRALEIRERLLGIDHPSLAGVLTNLANIYRVTGEDAKALETQFRALRLWETELGAYSRETLLTVGNIARVYAGTGDIEHALVYQRRADEILEIQMGLYVATGSERQKLAFVRAESERTDRTLSLHLMQAPDSSDAASLAALVLLQRKGRVLDAMTDLFASVRQRVTDAGDRVLLDQLKDTRTQLARIALGGTAERGGRTATAATLESKREQLESELSEHSAEFRAQIRPITLEAVQAAIPGDAALVEYAVFRPFDPEAERNEEAYGPPHYTAYVIARHGAPVGVDLGAVEDIDRLVVRMRDAVRDPSAADVKARGRALDERIMQPIRASLSGVTRLLISPDGGLNLVPFEALVDDHGRFLIERYATTYLTSGRDLLRMDTPRATPGSPVIIADPLFGEPAAALARRSTQTPVSSRETRSVTVAPDMSTLYFAPLSGSAMEGRAIKSLFPEARLLTGRRASKAALEQITAPSILHIASHGFFLADDDGATPGVSQNPLLRSGLALAGANLPAGAHGAGILTALEAAGLDLWGTHLVTLSACDTGVGEVRNGEGVYGLRRAFMLAGAETLVMSLWPVTDSIARDTMVAYYARLRTGTGRGDALRQAKLSILKRPAQRHPYYWAGFIQSGDWTRLRSH